MFSRRLALAAALLPLAACARDQSNQTITYDNGVVEARGWTAGQQHDFGGILQVYASDAPDAPPLAGDYSLHGATIRFTPKFMPSPDVNLRVVYHQADGTIASAFFPGKGPRKVVPATKVSALYPSTTDWPANTLKLYIQFSGPMKKGVAWSHIHLLDDKGQAVIKPFVEIDQELWDPADTRLTVLFDPGRIKRGLLDNRTEGPPLVPGRHYTVKVDQDWPDSAGAPMTQGFQKAIMATPAVRMTVDTKTWKVAAPARNQALVITFPRPMDYALARDAVTVKKGSDAVAGKTTLADNETRWIFVPDHEWAPGDYNIHVQGTAAGISDTAGNLLGRLFDMDKSDLKQQADAPAAADIPFKVA